MDETEKRLVVQSDAWRNVRAYVNSTLKIKVENLMKRDYDFPSTQFTRGYIQSLVDLVNRFEKATKRGERL